MSDDKRDDDDTWEPIRRAIQPRWPSFARSYYRTPIYPYHTTPIGEPLVTDHPMPERQRHAIELQKEIIAAPDGAPFPQSFQPHADAVALLAKIAGSKSPLAADARRVLAAWRAGMATPEQMARVETDDELEVGGGAVISPADDGFWVSTWSWLYNGDLPIEDDPPA